MREYKNYTSFSYLFTLFFKVFPWAAGMYLFIGMFRQIDWRDVPEIAMAGVMLVILFLMVQYLDALPFRIRTSPEGFEVKMWRQFKQYPWSMLRSVRYSKWAAQVDLFLAEGFILKKRRVLWGLTRPECEALVQDIKRYAPEVRFRKGLL